MNGYGRSLTPMMTFHIPGITFCHGTPDLDSPCHFGAGRRNFSGKLSCIDEDTKKERTYACPTNKINKFRYLHLITY
jgi:hypothetical protein